MPGGVRGGAVAMSRRASPSQSPKSAPKDLLKGRNWLRKWQSSSSNIASCQENGVPNATGKEWATNGQEGSMLVRRVAAAKDQPGPGRRRGGTDSSAVVKMQIKLRSR
jgi:hypothetical protein